MKKLEKVILLKDNEWGRKHEVKFFKRGFVLNYLLPQNEVSIFNEHNYLIAQKKVKKEMLNKEEEEKKIIEKVKKINEVELKFTLHKDENNKIFGSINSNEIIDSLAKKELIVTKEQLLNFDKIHEPGKYSIKVRVFDKNIAEMKVVVN